MDLAKPVQSLIGGLGSLSGLPQGSAGVVGGAAGGNPAATFSEVLKGVVNQTVDAQKNAEQLTLAAAQGQPVALQDVVQAVSQAELTQVDAIARRLQLSPAETLRRAAHIPVSKPRRDPPAATVPEKS